MTKLVVPEGETYRDWVNHHGGRGDLTAEASTLGLRPGSWPEVIEYEGIDFGRKYTQYDSCDDVEFVVYEQGDGLRLRVWND